MSRHVRSANAILTRNGPAITGRLKEVLEQAVVAHAQSLAHPGGQLIGIPADITTKDNIARLTAKLSAREGRVDVLANNAGLARGSSTVEKGDESVDVLARELWAEDADAWEEVHRTNVIGLVLL